MSLNLANDWMFIDNLITISYFSKTSEGSAGTPGYADVVTIPNVARNKINAADVAKNPALLQKNAMVFHLWVNQCSDTVPQLGDKIVDDLSVPYVVKQIEFCDWDVNGVERYRLMTTQSTSVT